jgi:hypothetical protein
MTMLAKLRERLKGWKTVVWNAFLGFAPVILVGLDKIQAIDLTQYMTWYMAKDQGGRLECGSLSPSLRPEA